MNEAGRRRFGLGNAAAPLAAFLFPPVCPLCRTATAEPHALCATCWKGLAFIERPFCEVLGAPLPFDAGPGTVSAGAIADPPRFNRLRAAVLYEGGAGRLVSALKYSDRTELVPMMAGWMARAGDEVLAGADVVVPVPLHPLRLVLRRFNQSAELARHVARVAARPCRPELLRRSRWTRRQVGLGAPERRRNVRAAFAVPDEARAVIAGRRVLLVDDVFTTGATVDAATLALRRGGAATVDVLVFARVAAPLRGVHMLEGPSFRCRAMASVTIYTRDFCSYSTRAKQLLQRKGVAFEEKDATSSFELRAEMRERAGGASTFPQIFIGERHVGGCDDLHALDQAGELDPLLERAA